MKKPTGIVYSDTYLEHDTGGHPESPRRLTAIMDGLETRGILRDLVRVDPVPARPEEIELVHKPSYIKWVEEMVNRGETIWMGYPIRSRNIFWSYRRKKAGRN